MRRLPQVVFEKSEWIADIIRKYGENSLEVEFAFGMIEALEKKLPKIVDELFDLFARKQADYGPNNIAISGTSGIIVRLSDKMSRITNLIREGRLNDPSNESVEDTLMDMSVYPVMGLLTYRGIWPTVFPEEAWKI